MCPHTKDGAVLCTTAVIANAEFNLKILIQVSLPVPSGGIKSMIIVI